jgi:iron complex outermembrane receptor protein
VRLPSRLERDLYQPARPPYLFVGNPQFRSEVSNAFEVGYRGQPSVALSYSATLFYQRYERLRSTGLAGSALQFANDVEGHTRGFEGWLNWQVAERWKLAAGGSSLQKSLDVKPGATAIGGTAQLGNDPSHHWSLRSAFDVSARLAWDFAVRRTAELPNPQVPAYTALDMRWAWTPEADWEAALVLENLTDRRHAEWGPAGNRVELGRSASLQLRWRL